MELTTLRGQIARLKSELEALADAEHALSEKLRTLGLDESITTVDLPTVAGLPSRRSKRRTSSSSLPPPSTTPAWVPAAVGAGLVLGVAIVVLLALNLQQSKRAEAPPVGPSPLTSVAVPAPAPASPPSALAATPPAPVPPSPPASATPAEAASVEPPKPEMGSLSIVCTPRCDSIVDNGVALTPGNVVALPVRAGPHKVVVSAGPTKRTLSVTVLPGQAKELRIDLERPTPVRDPGF